MPNDADSPGLISLGELKELAELFDAAEYALEPDSPEAKMAQISFDQAVQRLFEERVTTSPAFSSVPQPVFKAKIRTLCRQFLRRN